MRPWRPCSQGPHRASVWAWWEVPVMCLYPWTIRAPLAVCTWAVDVDQGEQLARELRHEHHHGRVRREPLGAQLVPNGSPYLGQVTGPWACPRGICRSPCTRGLRRAGARGQRPASSRSSRLSISTSISTCRATASGVDERSAPGSMVDPCWTLRSRMSTHRIPW